jgi:histidine triad (HIT) family protein
MAGPACIFCKIIKGEFPANIVFEDNRSVAFLDIRPVNLGHVLLVSRDHYDNLYDLPENVLEEMAVNLKRVAKGVKTALNSDGINIGMNNGQAAGQIVHHAHMHIIPRYLGDGLVHWPGKEYTDGEMKVTAERIKNYI